MTADRVTREEIDALLALDGFTPGPWVPVDDVVMADRDGVPIFIVKVYHPCAVENAALIAAAPDLHRALAAERKGVDAAEAENARLLDEIKRLTAENERMRNALTFYTISDNWRIDGPLDGNSGGFTGGPAEAVLKETSHDR